MNTPPHSGSGKIAGFVSAISTQLENVSSSRSDSSNATPKYGDDDSGRLRKELARMKAELRTKDKQLLSTQRSLQICEEEIDALESECKEKIAQVQHEVRSKLRVNPRAPTNPRICRWLRFDRKKTPTSETSCKLWR